MAFALALFVNAANGKIAGADALVSARGKALCDELYLDLCGQPGATDARGPRMAGEASLYQSFRAVCQHCDGHPEQVPLCARVLAFHFLMLRSAGAVLAGWAQAHPSEPRHVLLPQAVINAIARVRLDSRILLQDSSFLEQVELMARKTSDSEEIR